MALPKIDVPTYETKLISNGKTVKFRPFLVKEQKLFLMAAESSDFKEIVDTIKQVLNNCILTEDVNVDELSTFDLEYLFLQLRSKSVGEVVNLQYTCNNKTVDKKGNEKVCGGVVKFDVNLAEIKPEIPANHTNNIKITDNLGIVFKYPTFKMLNELENSKSNDALNLIVSCIDYIYDADQIYYAKDTTKEELVDFLENMQQDDFEKLQQFFNTFPKISKELDFKCPKCGYHEVMNVEGLQNFFG